MLRTLILISCVSFFVTSAAQAGYPGRTQRRVIQSHPVYHSNHETWLESVIGRPVEVNPRPMQRTMGLPTGRTYYGNRYFGNFNNRYFGPQYGYF